MGGLHTVFFFVLLLRCRVTLGNSFPFAVICFICLENGSAVIGLQMVWRHGVVYEQYSFKLKNNYFNISQWTKHHNEYHSFSQNTISGWKARDSKLSVTQSYPALPHKWQHTRLPCLSPTFGACSNSSPSSWWCHSTVSSSVVPFSSCLHLSEDFKCLFKVQTFEVNV